ncbi:hypothetical protein [Microbacterium sp. NPDC080220]|uniref:hypothetical protein n=1 Tax=Microbacterium sp. NPDC080220 TaxID=3161017 RepID=UPI003423B287
MTPQARGVVPPETIAAIKAAQRAAEEAELELHRVTVQALVDGASFPELTRATGFSSSTLQRWVKELGATPAGTAAKRSARARDALHIQRVQAMREEG